MSGRPDSGGDAPQVPTEPVRRAIRALPTRKVGMIERQVQAQQQSQQQARQVELRSYEQDEQLRLRIIAFQLHPDSRAGSPAPEARAYDSDSSSHSDSDSDSDTQSDSELGQDDPSDDSAQAQWHPEWHQLILQGQAQDHGPLGASPHQQDTHQQPSTSNTDPLSMLAAIAGGAPRVPLDRPSIHTVPLECVTTYSSLAGALTPIPDPVHQLNGNDTSAAAAVPSYATQSSFNFDFNFNAPEGAMSYHSKPTLPEFVEGFNQGYTTSSASDSMDMSSALGSGGLHSSDTQSALSSSQYDSAPPPAQSSSGQGENDKGKANERDNSGYQQEHSFHASSQSMPSSELLCQLSTYWCTEDNAKKYRWTSYGVEASCLHDGMGLPMEFWDWVFYGCTIGNLKALLVEIQCAIEIRDHPELHANNFSFGNGAGAPVAASGSMLDASNDMDVNGPIWVPSFGQTSIHTGLPMDTAESSSFAQMPASGGSATGATGDMPPGDLIEVGTIQHPLSPSESLPVPTATPVQLRSELIVSQEMSLGQLASQTDVLMPDDAGNQGLPRVPVSTSVSGDEHNQDLDTEQAALHDTTFNVPTQPASDSLASGTGNPISSGFLPELDSDAPAAISLTMVPQPSAQDEASPSLCPLPSSAPSCALAICPACGSKVPQPPLPSQSPSAPAHLPVPAAFVQPAPSRSTPMGGSPASEQPVHSSASHSADDEESATPRTSPLAVPVFRDQEGDSVTEASDTASCSTTPSSPIKFSRSGRDFWDETVFSLLGDMFQGMSMNDDERPPVSSPTLACSTEPETLEVEVLPQPKVVRKNGKLHESHNESSSKRRQGEVAEEGVLVEVAKAHEVHAPMSSSEEVNPCTDSEAPSVVTTTTSDSGDLLTPISRSSSNSTQDRTNNVYIADWSGSDPEDTGTPAGSLEAQLCKSFERRKAGTRKLVKRAQRARSNRPQTQTIEATALPRLAVQIEAPVLVPAVSPAAEEAIASINLNGAEAQAAPTVQIAAHSIVVETKRLPIPKPEGRVAASSSAIPPRTSLLFGAGTSLLSGPPAPLRERVVVPITADQQRHDPPKIKTPTWRTSRNTAKGDDVDRGARPVARIKSPSTQPQMAGTTGPRFFDIAPAPDVGVTDSVPAAGPLKQDDSEELRMPGGADFGVEACYTPRRPIASQGNWTPPSPPPSPPRRRNGYSCGAPAKQEVQLADAVDEIHQAPVPETPAGGGLVEFMISRCARYLGFA